MPDPGAGGLDVEHELDRIYALPPGEFTPARNDLAKRLRKAGESDAAERVAGLRRPPIAAWALNQLAMRAPDEVADLSRAGEELVEAQSAALGGGGDPREFEAAQRHQRDAVTRLRRTARGLLEEAGQRATDQTLERVASSLRAASVDEEGRRLLERGRFEDDFEGGSGLLALAGLAPPPSRAPSRPKRRAAEPAAEPEPKRDERAERARRREELEAARQRVRAAEQEERAAERAVAQAEQAAAKARKAAEEAEKRAEAARRSLDRAREESGAARAAAESLDGKG